MSLQRKIIHIDMDAFFASIEQKDHPQFRGKPLIVGGSPESRGVVAACSYEARKYGIHSAMPCARAVKLCPHAVFTRPRMARYKEVSLKVMSIFKEYTDLVEPLSLDEAYLDATKNSLNQSSATVLAEIIRQHIYGSLQLTASAGVSYNKFLAKVASDINKPNGIKTIPPDEAIQFLESLPIRKFFGVGEVTEKKMLKLGIKTGKDLMKWTEDSLLFHFGKSGSYLYNMVRGNDERPVAVSRGRKSIGSETTLSIDTKDMMEIETILNNVASTIEEAMTAKNCTGQTLTLKLRYHDFVTITRSITVRIPISSRAEIVRLLPGLLQATQAGTKKIRLLGLSISKLSERGRVPRQLYLPFCDH